MERPDYVHGGEPSLETWELACALSQEWADNARQAAHKRRVWQRAISTGLLLSLMLAAAALLFILAFDIQL